MTQKIVKNYNVLKENASNIYLYAVSKSKVLLDNGTSQRIPRLY